MNHSQSGFTMIEVSISVLVISAIVVILGSFATLYQDSFSFTLNQTLTQEQVNSSLTKILSELRETRVSEEGAFPIQSALDQDLAFFADVDNDQSVELVRYYLTGTSFYRQVIEPGQTTPLYQGTGSTTLISDQIRNGSQPVFFYYNGNWPADTTSNPLVPAERLLDTRMIGIRLLVNTSPMEQQDIVIETQIHLRNLKTNY